LAIVTIGGGSGKSENDIDQNRDGGEIDESFVGPHLANEKPTKEREMAEKTGAHQGKEERSDRPPHGGERFVGNDERDDDKKIEEAEDEFLKARVLEIGDGPASEREPHRIQPGQADKKTNAGSLR